MLQVTDKTQSKQMQSKYCIKLPLGYVNKVYVKCKQILNLDLGHISKISYYIYATIEKSEEIPDCSGPKHLG